MHEVEHGGDDGQEGDVKEKETIVASGLAVLTRGQCGQVENLGVTLFYLDLRQPRGLVFAELMDIRDVGPSETGMAC